MTILSLTLNHVRNRFRKLPISALRVEHLQTSARKAAGATDNVYITNGDENWAIRLDGHMCDSANTQAAKTNRAKAFATRKPNETLAQALARALRGE